MSFLDELKRRNVIRVGIAYVVVGWLILQFADVVLNNIEAPGWVFQVIMLLLAIGFPIVLVFAWAFELTPDGIKKEKDVDRSQSIAPKTGRKLNNTILILMALVIGYLLFDKFSPQKGAEPFSHSQQSSTQTALPMENATPLAVEPEVSPDGSRKSIVVLPFVNMSNDPEQEFFSDGLSEEILNVLAQIQDLRVISRTSAFAFKGKDVDIPTIAAQLNVSHVLEGSVRKAGDDVRITAQLIEVETDSHLWSDAYNRKLENVFEIQEEISEAIAAELQVTLGTSGRNGKPTDNLEAWQLYLRGRHLYQNRGLAQLERSVELLKQAVELDPEFADAWATLAAASLVYAYNLQEGFEDLYRAGEQAALRAVQIDPNNGFGHAALGLVHMGEFSWDEAMREYDLGIRLNPNETNSLLWKGIALMALGYVDQAISLFQQAEGLDPVFTNVHNWLASAYTVKGDYKMARHHIQKIQRLDPDFSYNWARYGFGDDSLDSIEELLRAEHLKSLGSDVLAVALITGLRDPVRKDEAVQTILANENLAEAGDLTEYLWTLGAVEECIANFQKLRERGRGLHASNSMRTLWTAKNREQLSDPLIPAFFEASDMMDYWREHGNPDVCRVDGVTIECDTH